MLSKAVMLHGMGALPSLAGLKPGQGSGQTDGAVSDSPIAPSSPLIAAKNRFAQVGIVTGLLSCPALSVITAADFFPSTIFPLFVYILLFTLANCASILPSTLQDARSRHTLRPVLGNNKRWSS